jgi:hypothetical protein
MYVDETKDMLLKLIKPMGANAIEDLSRNRGYVQLAYRKAIELPIVGYESDSLRFINL